ncbi:GH3 auxin-responsive promoter family protein [Leptolyngbya sp. FACHB-541]|uniref:GH3 auxin-responsive promoter family protein n=1 Tax=Leptolyngbya sp. FACHB-541 TaxID=2692810 RepID=UPI0016835C77|nr:GH3 auxin-responsive promoter family protein [Leptolyngbya sp. FACHB-541]MBD1999212.1 GH3 auxin-responsive promoter family protein [Leptolyngbya sp. FACHB-541]
MTKLFWSLLATMARQAKVNFVQKTRHADAVQEQFLRSLLQTHQNTEFGHHYKLSEIKTIEQFRERIPVQPYSSYQPFIERMANGETNILVPDRLLYFNLTSGSTGRQKLVPVTKRSRRAISQANWAAMGFAIDAARQRGLSLGKLLFTSSAKPLGRTAGGVSYGPVSTSDLRLSNILTRQFFAYPWEALQISDSFARQYVCLLFALRNPDLKIIGATFPVLALQLANYLEQYADSLIHDLETGEIASWLSIEPDLRASLMRHWSIAPQRATQLRQIAKVEGRLTPILAWTNLSLVSTARGGTSNFYLQRFPQYFGDTPIFGGVYAASETTFGISWAFNTDSVIPAIETSFLEFIPEDQWETAQPQTQLLSEVRVGDRYRIVMTNYSGFYRYDIGDIVQIDGFFEQAPLITFQHRQGGVISSTTEKTTEFHVLQVMQILQQTMNVLLENFCITLSNDQIPDHYWVNIELAPGYVLDDPVTFLSKFDTILKSIHPSYEAKRQDQIPSPRLRILESGSFTQVRNRLIQRGVAESHLKFPLVSEDRNLLEGLKVEQEVQLTGQEQDDCSLSKAHTNLWLQSKLRI